MKAVENIAKIDNLNLKEMGQYSNWNCAATHNRNWRVTEILWQLGLDSNWN